MFSAERSRSPSPERPARPNRGAPVALKGAARGPDSSAQLAQKIAALAQTQHDARRARTPVPDATQLGAESRKRARPLDLEQREQREQRLKFEKVLAKAPKPPVLEPPLKRRKTDDDGAATTASHTMTVREIEAELATLEQRRRELLRLKAELLRQQPPKTRTPSATTTPAHTSPAPRQPHTPQQREQHKPHTPQQQQQREPHKPHTQQQREQLKQRPRQEPGKSRTQRHSSADDDESEGDFIDRGYTGDDNADEALYAHNYSDFIAQLGFSRGPTSVHTYRELGGKMDRAEEASLRALEREWRDADKGGAGSFLDASKAEARTHHAALRTDAEEARREREERAAKGKHK